MGWGLVLQGSGNISNVHTYQKIEGVSSSGFLTLLFFFFFLGGGSVVSSQSRPDRAPMSVWSG